MLFRLPDLGEGLEDAEITGWLVAVGDEIVLNQPLCTVETAKAEVEVPSPFAGSVVARHGEVGDIVPVGAVLVEIADSASLGERPPMAAPPRRSPVLVGYGAEATEAPRRRRRSVVGDAGARSSAPVPVPDDSRPSTRWGTAPAAPRPLAKPPVRLLARRLGVDLAALAGSSPHGTITRDDVERSAAGAPRLPVHSTASIPGEVVPVRGARRVMAERMAASRREIPDAGASVTVDMSSLLRSRAALLARAEADNLERALTPFALLCALTVESLRHSPLLNSSFDAASMSVRVHDPVHLGVAVATPRGLVVAVVPDAHELGAVALAGALRELADGARAATLTPAQLQGSTFTVTNFGSLGLDDGYPIINPPEAAILGVGAVRERPWVDAGELVVRPTASLSCVFDHRVLDGAMAAGFLTDLRDRVEAVSVETLR